MPFRTIDTPIEGLKLIEPRVFEDDRGFFYESHKASDFGKLGINVAFVQDNHSKSSRGVLRGLHFQTGDHAQAKLVRVIRGRVFDVAVDIRPESPTYKKWYGVELSESNRHQLYIPVGFAHGFLTLEDNTEFLYKCSAEYHKESESGIIWNDETIAVEWPLEGMNPMISEKDLVLKQSKEVLL